MGTETLFDGPQEVPKDKLDHLAELVHKLKKLEVDVEAAEQVLKDKKKELEEVSRISIPSVLNEVGLSELRLSTGEKVLISDKIKASVADKNYLTAYNNMIKAEGGDEQAREYIDNLFKSRAVIEDVSDEVLEKLIDEEIPYEMKRDIPWQTLNKYCRERLESGKEIPEGISFYQYQETKIK